MLTATRISTRSLAHCCAIAIAGFIGSGCASQDPTNVPITSSTVAANQATASELQTPDDAVFVTIELQVDPAKMTEFLAVMAAAAPDTRAFSGCRLFDIYVDDNTPGRVLFYEIWDSKPQQQAYIAWRTETKFRDQIAPFLTGGSPASFYRKFSG